jgi:toxin ParE1/3/4
MTYRVEFSFRALHDLEILYVEKNVAESQAAWRWFNGLEKAVEGLATLSHRCPIAPEAQRANRELRNLLYGNKPHIYRVIYEVDEPNRLIKVFHIRHGARPVPGPSEIL